MANVIERGSRRARAFNEEQTDENFTSLPRKDPDIFSFDKSNAMHLESKSRRNSLYRDSTVVVKYPSSLPNLSLSTSSGGEHIHILNQVSSDLELKKGSFDHLLWFLIVNVVLLNFTIGFCYGLLPGMLLQLNKASHTEVEFAVSVSIMDFFAFLSLIAFEWIGYLRTHGRRQIILIGSFCLVVGSVICLLFHDDLTHLAFLGGRSLLGIGMGLLSFILPFYIFEILTFINRTRLLCYFIANYLFGFCIGIWTCYAMVSGNLPTVLIIQSILCCVVLTVSYLIIVETPYWLLSNNFDLEGFIAITNLYNNGDINHPKVKREYQRIKQAIPFSTNQENDARDIFANSKKKLLIMLSLSTFTVVNGTTLFNIFMPVIVNFKDTTETLLVTASIFTVHVLALMGQIYLHLINKLNQKQILLLSIPMLMIILLFLIISNIPNISCLLIAFFQIIIGFTWAPISVTYLFEVAAAGSEFRLILTAMTLRFLINAAFEFIAGYLIWNNPGNTRWIYLFNLTCIGISFYFIRKYYYDTIRLPLEDVGDTNNNGEIVADEESVIEIIPSSSIRSFNASRTSNLIEPPTIEDVANFKKHQTEEDKVVLKNLRRGSENISIFVNKFIRRNGMSSRSDDAESNAISYGSIDSHNRSSL
ncbi:hypothetical protein KAFR_0H01700 [Kazachstania africana CBS 2517]|uniref:Major facilitator superfamily (MFS) profile domain-containing protein n=1 Tax=Kazachstania africana (strain ATCC 22294 / BCRC 22015 / CBS 2517 / CECT 1963 / NBRC 1671 / NRRL Y-8276) TaxID=1071382 RepID=H2AZ24_KAZAF|nr:hypothetical protein KAFR_0H01700 [Kazachstania africana CBS 2517]CCF59580.1 hypothetical protein KAFR_0H01700 [Kazachstania africana CBS 2517]